MTTPPTRISANHIYVNPKIALSFDDKTSFAKIDATLDMLRFIIGYGACEVVGEFKPNVAYPKSPHVVFVRLTNKSLEILIKIKSLGIQLFSERSYLKFSSALESVLSSCDGDIVVAVT